MTRALLVVVGATGTGKSGLAIDVAETLRADGQAAEIVNADAMQLYRGMDIGTAKVPLAERREIPHHLLDVLAPDQEASVAAYQEAARRRIEDVQARGAVAILVGGSGLYVSSVIHDLAFPPRDRDVRARLESDLERDGAAALHARLAAADPAAAAVIDPANGRRVVRALEVVDLQGSFSPGRSVEQAPWREATTIVLGLEREDLVQRLDARVERMWEDGLLAEATALREGAGLGQTAARAIGYAQAIAVLDGRMSRDEAIAATQQLTRRYARRQVSWFRRYRDVRSVHADDPARTGIALAAVRDAMRED